MIYTQQSVRFTLQTGVDLSTASNPKILYRKPNGDTGEWPATIDGENLFYVTNNTDLDRKGVWRFQAFAVISGLNKLGKIAKQTIDKRL